MVVTKWNGSVHKHFQTMNSLVYLGYGIGGGELKIYPTKMEPIIKWLDHTSFIEVRIYFMEA
jgi:hypothetical protein